ncbi:MAG: class I SAM-dependent methyltransferase [Thermodesulfobacteriota bacterium]
MTARQLFDDWPERYDRWFETPVGRVVFEYERALVLDLLGPARGERILDAGSGTGLFTRAIAVRGADVVGLDISWAMLRWARQKSQTGSLRLVTGEMTRLPFGGGLFDKTVSVTALEFIDDQRGAVAELFRVTKPGGIIVVATLNALSPWADRRRESARREPESLFNRVHFRTPEQLLAAAPVPGIVRTAIHFGKADDPAELDRIERAGQGRQTGAFVAARWEKR